MKHYVQLNSNGIVVATLMTKNPVSSEWLEVDYCDDKLGKKWNGSTFEDVLIEKPEENVEVTNQDLLDVLLEIGEKVGI